MINQLRILCKYFLLVTVYQFTIINLISAQENKSLSEYEIKLSNNFYWGEGYSTSKQEGLELAKTELAYRIISDSTTILNHINSLDIDNKGFTFRYINNHIPLISSLSCTEKQKRDSSWIISCHIQKKSYLNNVTKYINDIINNHSEFIRVSEITDINNAIKLLVENWLESRYLPVVAYIENHDSIASYSSYLEEKLEEWSSNLQFRNLSTDNLSLSNVDTELVNLHIEAMYNNLPLNNVLIDIAGNNDSNFRFYNGRLSIQFPKYMVDEAEQHKISIRPDVIYNDLRTEDIDKISSRVKIARLLAKTNVSNEISQYSQKSSIVKELPPIRASIPNSREIINELIQIDNSDILFKWLESQARLKNLVFTTYTSDVEDQEDYFIAIINPAVKSIHSILSQETAGSRVNLTTGESIDNPSDSFRGIGVGPVWIKLK